MYQVQLREGAQRLPVQRLNILQVIHGYPMRYNAGSEVYTQGLAQALAERHKVHVFTREENAFLPRVRRAEG